MVVPFLVYYVLHKGVQPVMKRGKQGNFERRIQLLFYLLKNNSATTLELSHLFGVCRKTITRDVAYLSRYAPIYTKNGMYGGIFIMREYRSDLFVYLSKDEENLLKKILEELTDDIEIFLINSIINRYSMPEVSI